LVIFRGESISVRVWGKFFLITTLDQVG
jgi:hypothetical protein